jgi:hypothetical protein
MYKSVLIMSQSSSLKVVVDGFSSKLLDLVDDSLGAGLYQFVFIFKHLGQEGNGVIENNEEAFTHNLEQVLHDE